MITSKQRAYLRSLTNKIEPIVYIGKAGITENLVEQVSDALEAREIVKELPADGKTSAYRAL